MNRYWRCPNCDTILQKGLAPAAVERRIKEGRLFTGTITCGNCTATFPQSEVYGGQYDVTGDEVVQLAGQQASKEAPSSPGSSPGRLRRDSDGSDTVTAMPGASGRPARGDDMSGGEDLFAEPTASDPFGEAPAELFGAPPAEVGSITDPADAPDFGGPSGDDLFGSASQADPFDDPAGDPLGGGMPSGFGGPEEHAMDHAPASAGQDRPSEAPLVRNEPLHLHAEHDSIYCDVCARPLGDPEGILLTADEVAQGRPYLELMLERWQADGRLPEGELREAWYDGAREDVLSQGGDEPWLVCDWCVPLFPHVAGATLEEARSERAEWWAPEDASADLAPDSTAPADELPPPSVDDDDLSEYGLDDEEDGLPILPSDEFDDSAGQSVEVMSDVPVEAEGSSDAFASAMVPDDIAEGFDEFDEGLGDLGTDEDGGLEAEEEYDDLSGDDSSVQQAAMDVPAGSAGDSASRPLGRTGPWTADFDDDDRLSDVTADPDDASRATGDFGGTAMAPPPASDAEAAPDPFSLDDEESDPADIPAPEPATEPEPPAEPEPPKKKTKTMEELLASLPELPDDERGDDSDDEIGNSGDGDPFADPPSQAGGDPAGEDGDDSGLDSLDSQDGLGDLGDLESLDLDDPFADDDESEGRS